MRVLQVVQYFETGGLEQMVFLLARGLQEYGVECHVLAYVQDGALRERFETAGIKTVFLGGNGSLRYDLPRQIWKLIRREKFNLVHSHHLGPLMYSSLPSTLAGLPHIHTEHSVEFYDNRRRRSIAKLLARRAQMVAVSSQIAKWHLENLGTLCQVIDNGVTIPGEPDGSSKKAAKEALGIGADQFVVGCVARVAKEKRLELLLEGFAQFAHQAKNARLVVVGDGPERESLMRLGEELGLGKDVMWMGNRDDVYSILPAFDLLGLTSSREGLPLSLLEGMAHGVPVVATAVGGIPELLKRGGGTLVENPLPEAVAGAIAVYHGQSEKRENDGNFARELVIENYSVQIMVKKYSELYKIYSK